MTVKHFSEPNSPSLFIFESDSDSEKHAYIFNIDEK